MDSRKISKLASLIFTHSHNGILVTDAKRNIILVNKAFTKTTGYSFKEVQGKNPRILQSGKHGREFYQHLWSSITTNGYWQGEIWNRRKNGEIYPEWEVIHMVKDKNGKITNFFAIFSDLTDSTIQEAKIQKLQRYDLLTGLPNKASIEELLQFTLKNIKNHEKFSVLAVNIDRLAVINNSIGFEIGDKVIQALAKKMSDFIGNTAYIGRFTSDTFILIFPSIKNIDQVTNLTEKLIKHINTLYKIDNYDLNITTSMGVSIYPDSGKTADILINNAIEAMNNAKKSGRNTFKFSLKEHQEKSINFLTIENKLFDALKNKEFLLYYQPQVNINTGKIISVEALLRWHKPHGGLIPPDDFIPIAEENGLILPITEWILEEACRQNVEWQKKGLPPIVVSVNIPSIQLSQDNFVSNVTKILRRTKMKPEYLELEITERIIIQDVERNRETMHSLRKNGILLAIDDFGIGYSSLNYLITFPFDKLKIDASFIKKMTTDHHSSALVANIIAISKNLNFTTVAEGVETKDQLQILKNHSCDAIQGYYFSEPVPPNVFEKLQTKTFKV